MANQENNDTEISAEEEQQAREAKRQEREAKRQEREAAYQARVNKNKEAATARAAKAEERKTKDAARKQAYETKMQQRATAEQARKQQLLAKMQAYATALAAKKLSYKTKFENILLNYRYRISFSGEGIENSAFKEMSELVNETEVHTYKEGGLNGYVHKFAMHTDFTTITLKRGLSFDDSLSAWRQKVIDGDMANAKKSGTIKFYRKGENGAENGVTWNFYNAWPSKMEISGADAASNGEMVIETIELTLERFERQ